MPRSEKFIAVTNCGAIAAIFIFYILTANQYGFWADEVRTVQSGQLTYSEMIDHRVQAGHNPVYFTISWFCQRLLGESEVALRLPSVIFGVTSIILLYQITKLLTNRPMALMAAGLLALNPSHIFLCHQARMYTLVQMLGLASTYVILRSESNTKLRHVGIFAVLTSLNMHTHFSAHLALAVQFLYLLVRGRPHWKLLGGISVATISFFPWYMYYRKMSNIPQTMSWLPEFSLTHVPRLISELMLGSESSLEHAWWTWIASGFLFFLMVRGMLILGRRGLLVSMLWLAPVFVGTELALNGFNILVTIRYFSTSIAIQMTLLALGAATPFPGATKLQRKFVVYCVFFLSAAFFCRNLAIPPFTQWREMARIVSAEKKEREVVVAISLSYNIKAFNYYYEGSILSPPEFLHNNYSSADGVWVCFQGSSTPPREAVEALLDSREVSALFFELDKRFAGREEYLIDRGRLIRYFEPTVY